MYGLKQSAHAFWKELLQFLVNMGFKRSDADPSLYLKHDSKHGLIMIISWIEDILFVGSKKGVEETGSTREI